MHQDLLCEVQRLYHPLFCADDSIGLTADQDLRQVGMLLCVARQLYMGAATAERMECVMVKSYDIQTAM